MTYAFIKLVEQFIRSGRSTFIVPAEHLRSFIVTPCTPSWPSGWFKHIGLDKIASSGSLIDLPRKLACLFVSWSQCPCDKCSSISHSPVSLLCFPLLWWCQLFVFERRCVMLHPLRYHGGWAIQSWQPHPSVKRDIKYKLCMVWLWRAESLYTWQLVHAHVRLCAHWWTI